MPDPASVYEDVFVEIHLFYYRPGAACNGRQRIFRDIYLELGLFVQKRIKPFEECPSPGKPKPFVVNVRGKIRRRFLKSAFYGLDNRPHRFLYCFADFFVAYRKCLGYSGQNFLARDIDRFGLAIEERLTRFAS